MEDLYNIAMQSGKIETDASIVGGIYGYTKSTVKYNYSMVNLETSAENIGGIGGQDGLLSTNHNLYAGNLFNKKINSSYVNRIIGSNITQTNNYAYKDQLISGNVSNDQTGCTFLYAEDILSSDIYNDDSILAFNDNFDYSELSFGIMPKLKNDTTGEILPNQKDIYLKEDKMSIKYLEFSKGDSINVVNVAIEINNSNEVPITEIVVDDMNVNILTNSSEDGITYITFMGTAIYYYDNYKISKIKYLKNGIEESVDVEGFIDARLYKNITSFSDWEQIDEYSRQNYRLMVDLDFTGRNNINKNVSIGRLEAMEEKVISGVDLSFSGNTQAFIKEITKSITNVTFDNCKVTNTSTGTSTSYFGLIGKVSGDMENIKFSNIEIQASNINRVGIIFRCSSMNINNIELDNIVVSGRDYVGGLAGIADSGNADTIKAKDVTINGVNNYGGGIYGYVNQGVINNHTNFSGENINVTIAGSYAGALIGRGGLSGNNASVKNSKVTAQSYAGGLIGYSEVKNGNNFSAENCEITSRASYAGGLIGYGSGSAASNYTSKDCIVKGVSYVGGAFGYINFGLTSIKVENANVTGTGNYVGGDAGQGGTHNYVYVIDSKITGKGNYIGGILGLGSAQNGYASNLEINGIGTNSSNVGGISGSGNTNICNVNNCVIETTGSNVGGLTGYVGGHTLQYSVFENSTVKGAGNVGGIAGTLRNGTIKYCHANGEVIGTGSNAGGIVGYLNNEGNKFEIVLSTPQLYYGSYIYCSAAMRVTVTANNNVGGLIGKEYQPILTVNGKGDPANYYYSNYIDVDLTTTTTETEKIFVSAGIGNHKEFITEKHPSDNLNLNYTYFYRYSKVNGKNLDESGDTIGSDQYLVLSDLKYISPTNNQSMYTTKLKWSSNKAELDTSGSIVNAYYPKQTKLSTNYYTLIELPNESELLTTSVRPLGVRSQKLISMANGVSTNLPNIEAYSIDVDKINLEFSRLDENTYFYIIQDYLQLENQYLNNSKVFSYKYNFKEAFDVIITNGVDTNIITIDPNKIANKLSVNNNKYYYLIGNELYLKDTSLGNGYLNLYKDKVIKDDNNVYLLENMAIDSTIDTPIELIDKQPFAEFEYNSYKINTYKNYSEVINGDVVQEKAFKLFVKNNKLYSLSNTLNINYDGIILDYYNQNEYETVLGNDGVLYDLKTALNYPKDFENSNIEDISNNLFDSNNVILVKYTYGKVYAFNYVTGEELYNNGIVIDISLKDYIIDKFTSDEVIMSNSDIEIDYLNSLLVKEKLEKLPISEFVEENGDDSSSANLGENTSFSAKNAKYVSVYQPDIESYVIYNEEELLTSEKPVTENSKIQGSAAKTEYYLSETISDHKFMWKGSTIVLSIIGVIIINLVVINKMNSEKKKTKRKSRAKRRK